MGIQLLEDCRCLGRRLGMPDYITVVGFDHVPRTWQVEADGKGPASQCFKDDQRIGVQPREVKEHVGPAQMLEEISDVPVPNKAYGLGKARVGDPLLEAP